MVKAYYYFSLGPVQEFVGKARRLRDYWTGSYLLSYLSKHAMEEVCKNGGQIVFPPFSKDKESIEAYKNDEIGSFPNRFQAVVPMNFDPTCCEKRIKEIWREIAEYVWTKHISGIAPLGRNTKEIWNRQVEGFWHMTWVMSDEENDALLDIRKNWRSYVPTVEPGDKCTLFGNLQEISGYIGSSMKGEVTKQKLFWKRMQSELASLDLKDGERLSAIALIKRVFPRVYNEFEKTTFPENFPSTTYMSAISWMERSVKEEKKLAVEFLKEARNLKGSDSEAKADIRCLNNVAGDNKALKNFISLDGNFFYSHTLLNDILWGNRDRSIRESLDNKLKKINERIGFEPDTYYALLSMDGDKIGAILQENRDRKTEISQAITAFSKSVPGIIKANNGRVIYAGGEDVFAILPVYTAIDAAIEMRKKYSKLFEEVFGSNELATISAAIIFAHHHAPLTKVYSEIQVLLDREAKKKYGRSTLAISTWNTGGPDLVWAMPWQCFLEDETGENVLRNLAKNLAGINDGEGISNSFIYNIRRDLNLFGDESSCFKEDEILEILTAEFIKAKAKSSKELSLDQVQSCMKDLLKVCSIYYRDEKGQIKKQKTLNFDGALLVKFLARRWYVDDQDMGV
jgi:CRISPR-associated protein Cmr2